MDSWTLQGDSYSFLRSAPRTFSLCHRDGTPNHVEIFDIINTPTQRSAISETTCLCDIFGDDCESPAHSSSPAVAAFVPLPRDEDGTSAASPPVDDLNDSGSYHTAPGSSEGEEGFEDSAEGHLSPPVETEERQSEPNGLSSAQPELFNNGSSNLEAKGKSPKPPLSAASPSLEVPSAAHSERTPSPGHSSPHRLSSEGRVSSLSSSSIETRRSSVSSGQLQSEAEARRITPTFKDRLSSPSHQSLTQSPSPQPRNCGSAASSESLNIQSEFTERFSPEPRSSSSAPGTSSKNCSLGFMSSAPESRGSLPSPFSSSSCTEFSSQSRETSISPELRETSCAPEIQASSPFSELRGRVSLPDLFSRGSTPDLEDSPQTKNLISDSEKEARNSASTPQSRAAAIPSETGSALSTPAPRYTPPSPVISFTPSPEPRVSIVSPELTQTSPSPDLLSASSLAKSQSRTPSPGPPPKINSPSPETSTHVAGYSLSPSPEVARNCTPIEHRRAAPSPEIRITPSSPENDWTEQSLKVETSDSPFLGPSFEVPSRSPSSSPHITGISYSVIQPEDRDSPPFPELCRLSSPESERTRASPEARSPTPGRDSKQSSRAASAGTPRHSPHVSGFASPVLPLEITHQSRYKTPSPQPKYPSPLPEARYPTPVSEKSHSPSPQDRSSDPSPQQRYNQKSPSTLFPECNPQFSQPTLPPHNTPEIRASPSSPINTKIEQPSSLETNISPSIEFNKEDKSAVSEIKGESPIATVQTPVSTSPLISEEKAHRSLSKQNTEREVTPKELGLQHISDFAALSEEKQETDPIFAQTVDPCNLPHTENKPPSSNLNIFGEEKVQRISPVQKITPSKPLQKPRFKNYSPTSGGSSTAKASSTPQLATKVGREKITKGTEGMAHHVNRRRTPSPPLTRFTPVHIIAPEKPYRQWQNRSPPQVVASSQTGNVKKVVTNRESPDVVPVDNNSQPHWVRLGKQLEMERKMQLEEEGEIGRERQRDREMERGKMREGRELEKGEEWQGDASYRGEQVELSFNARNRKGPASRGTAPTGRDTRQGLPTAHSYSESLLATRQLQQQQSLLRLPSQQDAKGGGPSRRLHPPVPQNKSSTRVVANRPCQSSSSSMGSEFDEADNEVKWFTDVAFSSLSSPEVDYLDMYNSSHRSSTNISQPSTQESPAGISASWPAYADFRGSAQKLDNDDPSFQQPSAYYSDGLDPAKCYEMGSFECIDVAVEREDTRKVRRGVPKRQIQLKRKDSTEGKQDESSDNSSPGVPMMALNSPSLESPSREALLRQHSTPATMQECYPSEHSPEPCQQTQRNSRLQKSASLDESSPKTKMATCLIKSVLSKKMQSVDKQADEEAADEVSPPFEENNAGPPLKESSKPVTDNPRSSHGSDYNPQFEGLAMRREERDEARPSRGFGVKPSRRPSSSSSNRSVNFSQTDIKDTNSPDRNEPSQKSEFKVPCERKQQSRAAEERGDDSNTWEENQGGDSANATARNAAAPPATGASSGSQARMTKKGQECENTEDYKQPQPCDKSPRMSKTQEITLKGVEKKKASLNVCLTPETENKPFVPAQDTSFREKEEGDDASMDLKTEEEDRNGNNKTNKVPIHKVRDVRRLVKNTYNLSFKATSSAPLDVAEERTEIFNEERKEEIKEERREERREEVVEREIRSEARKEEIVVERREEQKVEMKDEKILSPPLQSKAKPPSHLQIQCKAVCWKDDKNKTSTQKDTEDPSEKVSVKHITNISREEENTSTTDLQTNTRNDAAPPKPCQRDLKVEAESKETTYKVPESESKPVMVRTDRKPPMLGSLPRMPSKEREVSTAVVLIRDGSNKTKTSASASPAHEEAPAPPQAPAAPPSPELTTSGSTTGPGGHSVSMLLKEKGYHADIGSVVGEAQNGAGGKGVARKHVNCLEIPLQTNVPSDGRVESHRERTFSSSSTMSGPSAVSDSADTKTSREEENKDTAKQKAAALQATAQDQTPTKQKEHGDFEAVKRQDPTFPPRSPAIRRFRPQPIEVKSLSKEAQKQDTAPNSTGSNRPQTIEVKSIAKNAQKPAVPPKPTCKFKPADFAAAPIEAQRPTVTTSSVKPHGEERSQTIVVSSPTIYRKISNESNSSSNYTRKLAVSTVSSLKPPQSKITATTISSLSNQSASVDTEAHNDRGQQQQPGASPQISRAMQRPTTLATAPGSTSGGAGVPSAAAVPDPGANHAPEPPSAGDRQASQPAVLEPNSQVQYPREAYPHDQGMPVTSNNPKQPTAVSTTQAPGYTQQQYRRSMSNERTHRTDDMRFYVSDDPPSYDERESFSPLMLPDLTPRRSNRYQPSSRPPPCSCTAGCPPHPGLPPPPHHHRSPHNLTPPAPAHSPGQVHPYAQPPLRPHQCRSDPQPMSFQPSLSPKSSPLGQSQPPAMYQPLHQPPPHPSLMQGCPGDRPMQPIDPRRAPAHRSPQQPPSISGAPYSDPGHSHSPGLPPMDPQYLCGPPSLGQSYGSEYGGDSSSLYSEGGYGQTPRRVLMDPETGKYFYIEVPMQPLRKMLFDPETGQYVEVLIPQQAMSHSGLYPPSAAPYPPLHNPNMYAPAPQYMPYAAPPPPPPAAPPAHPQTQPPRYPEASAAATMHPNGPGVSYRNSTGQGSKPEPQNHPPLDQSYLEGMYYVPTGMNASPNPTPPVYYHKHPPNLPPTGGKRS